MGSHIALLVMSAMAYLAPQFITEGRLCWLRSPLYIVEDKGKYNFFFNDKEFNSKRAAVKGVVVRAKGLGELDDEVLRQSMFNETNQRMERLDYDANALDLLYNLMGEDVEPRREFIMNKVDFSTIQE